MTAAPSMLSVLDGRECLGFILSRGRAGFEAFDAELISCGIYATQKQAAASLPERKTT
jgi:hypothetical protein